MARINAYEKALPRRPFPTLSSIDRYKRICLGLPVPILSKVPFGYVQDEANPDMALPNEDVLRKLYKAREYLKDSSYAEVSDWLKSCGCSISHQGLFVLIEQRPPFKEILLPLEERMKLL